MTIEYGQICDQESVDLAKGIIYGLGLSEKQTLRTVSILQSLSPYAYLASGYCQAFTMAAEDLGMNVPSAKFCTESETKTLVTNRLVTFNDASPKTNGIVRGLSHGFHRSITIPHVIESAIKADYCDEHVWLIESDYRSNKYKRKPPLNSEGTRLSLALVSGMADKVGLIRGDGYSNDFYRRIVRLWKPDIYFINESAGIKAIKEAESRAKSVGGCLKVVREVGRSHTTQFEKLERYLEEKTLYRY